MASALFVNPPGSQQDAWCCRAAKLYTDITLESSWAMDRAQGEEGVGYPSLPLPLPVRPAAGRLRLAQPGTQAAGGRGTSNLPVCHRWPGRELGLSCQC